MEKIQWDKSFETGIDRIDFQHQNLLGLLNATIEASESEESFRVDAVRLCLEQVVNYTVYHFETEEGFLTKAQYPELQNHKKEHLALKAKVTRYLETIERGDVTTIAEVLAFLKDWLVNHIGKSDHAYIPYLAKIQDIL